MSEGKEARNSDRPTEIKEGRKGRNEIKKRKKERKLDKHTPTRRCTTDRQRQTGVGQKNDK